MAASLKFESAPGTAAPDLSQVKIIALEDNTGNKYTLDTTTSDLKVVYTASGGNKKEHTVNGLATALGSLLSTEGDDKKLVLVEKLGEFLDSPDKVKYDGQNDQTARVFLGDKGLKGDKGDTGVDGAQGPKGDKGDTGVDGAQGPKGDKGDTGPKGADGNDGTSPSAAEIAAEQALQEHVARISIQSPEFKRAVQEEMSQPYFEPPTSDDAALNWTW